MRLPCVDRGGVPGTLPPEYRSTGRGATQWTYTAAQSDPSAGLMVVECSQAPPPENPGAGTLRITAPNGLSLKQSVVASGVSSSTSVIVEKPAPGDRWTRRSTVRRRSSRTARRPRN